MRKTIVGLLFCLIAATSPFYLLSQHTSKMFDAGLEKFKTGYYKDAIVDFTKVIERNDQYFEAYYLRGRCYYELGKKQEALADFNRSVQRKKDYANALLYRGKYYVEVGEKKKAMEDFSSAISSNPRYTEAYVERALLKESQLNYSGAADDFSMAVHLNDRDKNIRHGRGRVYQQMKRYEENVQDQDAALSLDTSFAMAYYYRALGRQGMGKLRLAMDDYEKAIKLGVKTEEIYTQAGNLAFELYRFEKAVEYYTPLIKKFRTRNPEIHLNRGISYIRLRKFKQAEDDLARCIVYDKKNAAAFLNKGIANYRLGRHASAYRDFNRAIQLQPDYYKTYEQRGLIYFEQKRFDLAFEDFDKAISLRPTGDAHYHRGMIRSERGDRDGACKDLYDAKELGHPKATLQYPKLCE